MDKQQQRKILKEKRNLLSIFERNENSKKICDNALPLLMNSDVILSYCPFGSEVDITKLNNELASIGKMVCFPICDEVDMEAYYGNKFEIGKFGIKTLIKKHSKRIEKDKIDTILIPCIGYDLEGNRLGQGKGYYDRYLSTYEGKKILIAFSIQQLDSIIVTNKDERVEEIVTENGVFFLD